MLTIGRKRKQLVAESVDNAGRSANDAQFARPAEAPPWGWGPGRRGTPYFSEIPLPADPAFWERRGRFLDKHTIKAAGCWEWRGTKNQSGYGLVCFRVDGRTTTRSAPRLQWQRFNGPIPEGHVVMHTCDNAGCVNPDHLRLGTPQDNLADMRAKGRGNISGLRNQ